jgi:hypothetical protein
VVLVVSSLILAVHVVARAGLSGVKSSQSKFLQALIPAIESVYLAKERRVRIMARLEIYTYR